MGPIGAIGRMGWIGWIGWIGGVGGVGAGGGAATASEGSSRARRAMVLGVTVRSIGKVARGDLYKTVSYSAAARHQCFKLGTQHGWPETGVRSPNCV